MLNFIHRKYHYFIVVQAQTTRKENLVHKDIYNFIKRYFFWRGRTVKYFEPFVSKETQETYAIFGTAKGERTVNRNCLIFLLELYAALSSPNQFKISEDFKPITKTYKGETLLIYKIKK